MVNKFLTCTRLQIDGKGFEVVYQNVEKRPCTYIVFILQCQKHLPNCTDKNKNSKRRSIFFASNGVHKMITIGNRYKQT